MTIAVEPGGVDEKRDGRRFWDSNPCGGQWGTYREFVDWLRRTEPYAYDVLDRYDWKGKHVLEVGCGQGAVLNHLGAHGADVVGIDMSAASARRALAGARELSQADRVHASVGDAENLPFADATFDAAVSFGVLHHTPDTARGIAEIRRVVKPGGVVIVMLYRTGNPKWWATRTARAFSSLVDGISGEQATIANRIRARHSVNDSRGTALLELFGVPTLQAFSNREVRRMFQGFERLTVRNYSPGFKRLADIVPVLRAAERIFDGIDHRFEQRLGFYQVAEAIRR
jgi:SAM-dependent methyltransferase